MKRFFLPALLVAALFSAPFTSDAATGPGHKKARRAAKVAKKQALVAPKATSATNWGSDDDAAWAASTPIAAPSAVATAPAGPAPASDDAMMHSSGVMIAPGMNTAPYRGVSTDYNGRPLAKAEQSAPVAVAAPAASSEVSDDPMMHSSGVMIAPGMNTAPYRGVSTDYNGRPIRRQARKLAAKVAKADPVATSASATAPALQW